MIKAIIVDDEKMSRQTLTKLLELYCPAVQVISECENADEALKQTERLKPDLVFLDVAMPGKSGIDFLKGLDDIPFEVIFVTAHDKYVLQALRFSAVDYLSKPVEEKELQQAVANAEKRISTKSQSNQVPVFLHNVQQNQLQQEMQLCIPGIKGIQILRIKDIVYCEAQNTYTYLFLTDGSKILASRTLADYEALLQDVSFFRIHKSYLINTLHLKEYIRGDGGSVIMNNSKELEVSRRRKESFVSFLKQRYKY